MQTTNVRFEHRPAGEPALGLGTGSPRVSWVNADAPDAFAQASAEVKVTRTPWGGRATTETVTLTGPDQVLVAWPVAPLASRERAEVRVRVTGADGVRGKWSAPAIAEAGLLDVADWGDAVFVSPVAVGDVGAPAPALLGVLEVPGGVRAARLHITAHGWYEVLVNGARVGADWFGPGWTAYDHRLRVFTYDVTDLVASGGNEVAILLGEGWWRSPLTWSLERKYGDRLAALARLEVTTDAGKQFVLATDGTWEAVETHITANSLYAGERQDLRRPLLGERRTPVEPVPASLERLVAAEGPAVREIVRVPARRVWRSPSGKLLVDFGQNVVGVTALTVRGLATGREVVVRHAEVLEHDELGTRPLRKAEATDTYVVAGPDEAVLQPHFTFHGFRYAQVDGLAKLAASDISAVVLSSDLVRTGWFTSSDELLNQLHSNVVWGMRGNFLDIPTDCPQRDERLGWTGDIQVFSPSALYLMDAAAFLSSWAADLAVEQAADGTVPVVVPNVLKGGFGEMPAAAWGDAATLVPWNIYRATGDVEVLRRQLPSMRAWVDRVALAAGDDFLWTGDFQFGDWLDPDAPPEKPAAAKANPDVVATAYLYRSADVLAQACAAVGDARGEVRYRSLADSVRTAFRNRFVTADGIVHSDSATVYAQAICWGLLDDDQLGFAGDRLADLARLASFRIQTGFVGTPLICDALSLTGHDDIAYLLLTEQGCPSWLYPVTMGATTIWERWDSMLPDGTINPGEMTSFNHYALGAVADWMHRVVGGLSFDPVARVVTIAPVPGWQLEYASTRLLTPYGEAASGWRRSGGSLTVDAVVPAGLTGRVVLPGGMSRTVASGRHRFTVAAPSAAARPATVREVISSRHWPEISRGVLALLPLGDAKALAQGLERALDAPVAMFGIAATMGGMFGPQDAVQAVVDEALGTGSLPVVNTHVHFPPNFSAYTTPSEVIAEATAQGVRALGISNFYDQQVYARFDDEARRAGIVPLFGLEFITLDDALEADGVRVNDPANPGRIYFCGKGINPFKAKSDAAAATAAEIRSGNDERAAAMVAQLTGHFRAHGVLTDLDAAAVADQVARRGDVPVAWVSLQERHVARAYQEVVAGLPGAEQADALARVYGAAPAADPRDAVATQGEIRSRLIKAGTPGFVPEVPLTFADAYAYVLAMDGIPTYPILADGASPVSAWESPPAELAARLLERGVYAAELIPVRNAGAIVDEYVAALTDAGIIVMAGTEHNTLDRIPLDPACADGPLSDAARAAFFEATCIVAAHQHLVARGEPGYVDATGAIVGAASAGAPEAAIRRTELAALGADIIGR